MLILGLDPGASTGAALWHDGKLVRLHTWEPVAIADWIRMINPARVIFEDSRLTSPVWSRGTNTAARIKIARNVGQVDAWCSLIVAVCGELGIPAHGISPKKKGSKLDAEQFAKVTGWTGRSNAHERDAAMCAFRYRGVKA